MTNRAWSTATTMVLAAALALMAPTAARADAPDQSGVVERAPRLSAWLLSGDGLHVVTGPPLEEGCVGEGFQEPIATIVTTPSGVTLTHINHTDLRCI